VPARVVGLGAARLRLEPSPEGVACELVAAESERESHREHGTPKDDSEGDDHDLPADAEVFECHGDGDKDDSSLHAGREEPGRRHTGVDGRDQHGAAEEPPEEGAQDEQCVAEADVGIRLRKIACQTSVVDVISFGEQPDIVPDRQQPFEQPPGVVATSEGTRLP
jgi:hypothetical protein